MERELVRHGEMGEEDERDYRGKVLDGCQEREGEGVESLDKLAVVLWTLQLACLDGVLQPKFQQHVLRTFKVIVPRCQDIPTPHSCAF